MPLDPVPMSDENRKKILALLDQHRIMTIATLRPDGWPQATTVGFVNEGLTLYFLCGLDSQKAANLARDDRVSLTIDHDTPEIMAITGLSMAARAKAVTSRDEAEKVLRMLPLKYPEQKIPLPLPMPGPRRCAHFSGHADGHLGARLLQGLRTHRPRDPVNQIDADIEGSPRQGRPMNVIAMMATATLHATAMRC